jgi:ribosomal protein S18 acetylase RimI-like enzyme
MSQTDNNSGHISVERLQSYMRHVVEREREVIAAPPLTVFLDPNNSSVFFNYAIPDRPIGGDLRDELDNLSAVFAARQHRPRLEFIEEFAPDLAPALRAQGFAEQARMPLMICTTGTYQPVPRSAELHIITIDRGARLEVIRENLDTNNRGFDPHAAPISTEEAANFRDGLGDARLFTARLAGLAVAAGMYTMPIDRISELVGISTLAEFRRRGIAAALTSHMVAAAFANGVEVVCLSAADEQAGRVYERVGFQPFATMLAYIAPEGE